MHYNGGCVSGQWQYVDMANMSDQEQRWTDGNSNTVVRWSDIVAQYGPATVVYGQLVDDSQQFSAADRGTSYYDLVSLGNRTFDKADDAG